MYHPNLIFDVGAHVGNDTALYLAKGFQVVAVEANPSLSKGLEKRFQEEWIAGSLFVENVGIADRREALPFFVNRGVDEWSSFTRELGTRDNTRYEIVEIPCYPLEYFIRKYGMPYFLKIDVEGLDALVARQLNKTTDRPAYISVEDSGVDVLIALYEIGVRGDWLDVDRAFKTYFDSVRPPGGPPINGWWDIHGFF